MGINHAQGWKQLLLGGKTIKTSIFAVKTHNGVVVDNHLS